MNKKILILIILSLLISLGIGWLILYTNQSKKTSIKIDSVNSNSFKTVTIPLARLDSLLISSHDTSEDFSTKLKGRFVLKDAKYAGFNFYNSDTITWTNEMDAWHPDSLCIRWINHTTFYTRNIQRLNEKCPPRIDIYKVVLFDGQHLILSELSTGWNEHPDSHLEFYRNDKLED